MKLQELMSTIMNIRILKMIDLPIIIDMYLNSIPQRCDIKHDGRSHQSYYQRLKLPSELGLQIIHQILNRKKKCIFLRF